MEAIEKAITTIPSEVVLTGTRIVNSGRSERWSVMDIYVELEVS